MVNESAPKRLFVTTGEVESSSPTPTPCFIRTNPKGVQEKGFEQDIMAGEIRGSALDSFRALVANLFVPVLKNQTQWGKAQEENTHEFVQSVAKFGATLTEASNSLQGGVELMKPSEVRGVHRAQAGCLRSRRGGPEDGGGHADGVAGLVRAHGRAAKWCRGRAKRVGRRRAGHGAGVLAQSHGEV